jgi:glucosamine kinase
MILIADSGSTKTSWRLTKSATDVAKAYTIGYNPDYYSTEEMTESMRKELLSQLLVDTEQVGQIFFYGAGCSRADNIAKVKSALVAHFPAADIFVDHDLLGAARALCFNEPGIACILGTGSNSCLYDGVSVTDNVTSLGFTMGDEGSGGYMGKQLIRAYFYRELPPDLNEAFEERYKMTKSDILNNIYQKPLPNRFVAQFSAFCGEHRKHPFMKQLINQALAEFLDRHVLKYKSEQPAKVHFLGSIAFYFREELEQLVAERGLEMGKIIQEPVDELVKYHYQ